MGAARRTSRGKSGCGFVPATDATDKPIEPSLKTPTAFLTAWAVAMGCGVGLLVVARWSQRAGVTPEPPGGFVEDPAATACAGCGAPPVGRCARCKRPHCRAHFRRRWNWSPTADGDGLGRSELCAGCTPNRFLLLASVLLVFGFFAAICAGALSFPKQ